MEALDPVDEHRAVLLSEDVLPDLDDQVRAHAQDVPVDIPDLFVCSAFGDTPELALAEVERAKANWLAAARESGKPIPEPTYRPAIYEVRR